VATRRAQTQRPRMSSNRAANDRSMYKLITFGVAAIPVILFLRSLFRGQLNKSQTFSDFKKHMDYVVSAILFFIGCGIVYAVAELIWTGRP
jgi:hypothetical protein